MKMTERLQQLGGRAMSRFSFKNATILLCFLNLITALFLIHGFLSPSTSNRPDSADTSDDVQTFKYACNHESSDDDFVEMKPMKLDFNNNEHDHRGRKEKIEASKPWLKKKQMKGNQSEIELPRLSTRMSTNTFVRMINGLSNEQKKEVREMGFGDLLEPKINRSFAFRVMDGS